MKFFSVFLIQTDCFNYIKILLRMNSTHLYVCGTYAFSPTCAYIVSVCMKQSHLLQTLPVRALFCEDLKSCVILCFCFVFREVDYP